MDAIGPYRLDALVGRGTAGSVWRATRQGTVTQVVAIKRARTSTRTDVVDRLRQEAAILADLDHPHIVRVLDVLPDRSDVAIVMSYARGGSLHDLLAERGRLTPGQTVAVLARVADALGSAHRRGVLHGDVKPANILFTTDGEPLLGDFGVAQHLTPGRAGLDGVSGLRAVEGTTGFVDPELVATGRPEPRNDVYGLAVVAYVCLTGRQPHEGDTAGAVLAAADVGDHRPLTDEPDVPPALAALVEAALARDPRSRPASAEDVARGLRATVDPAEVVLPGTASVLVAPEPSIVGDAPDQEGPPGAPASEPGEEGDGDRRGGDDRSDGRGGGDLLLDDGGWEGVPIPDDLRDLDRTPPPPTGAPGARPPAVRPASSAGPSVPAGSAASAGARGAGPAASDGSGGRDLGGDDPDVPPDRGTRAFGPRPPGATTDHGRGRPLVTGLLVVLLLVGAVAGGLWVRDRLDEEQTPSEVAVDARAEPAGAACSAWPEPEVPPGAQRMEADLLGDGCPIPVVWDGQVLQLRLDPADERPRRYAFESAEGGSGHLVFGDWDCDGAESPALYQPSTGRVSYFSYVPERTDAEVEAVRLDDTGVVDGRPEVAVGAGADGCDVVEVVESA